MLQNVLTEIPNLYLDIDPRQIALLDKRGDPICHLSDLIRPCRIDTPRPRIRGIEYLLFERFPVDIPDRRAAGPEPASILLMAALQRKPFAACAYDFAAELEESGIMLTPALRTSERHRSPALPPRTMRRHSPPPAPARTLLTRPAKADTSYQKDARKKRSAHGQEPATATTDSDRARRESG
jgi:hypothetical protein